jgi:ATP-binding cassette subfamily G (WHITE) protein 2 (SNQ2)
MLTITTGLDASTALEWTKAVRAMTDTLGIASIATLYQAGNGMYNLFDKVLVLDQGHEIFYGSREEARPFMEQMGFFCDDSANIGDFLTGVTVPTERAIRPGFENLFPRTAAAVEEIYSNSHAKEKWIQEYAFPESEVAIENTAYFKKAIAYEKHKSLPKNSPLTTSFPTQVLNCVKRQYQILWGDKPSFIIKQGSTFIQALIVGSLFYQAPENSDGLFLKGGALFFSLLYHSLLAMSEVTDSFTGRPVLAKHKELALYHPAAFCIGQIAADIPVILFQVTQFSIVLYFMVGLQYTASHFFTYWFVVLTATFSMTACFRSVGAASGNFDDASKISGFLVSALIMYCGYLIPKGTSSLLRRYKQIFSINELVYP